RVPNGVAAMAAAEPTLRAYVALEQILADSPLPARTAELVALATAKHAGCAYCHAAHTRIGRHVAGLDHGDIQAADHFQAADPADAALLDLVRAILDSPGPIADQALDHARASGWTDEQIGALAAHLALLQLTTTINRITQPDVDW
ncbi:MAG: carboxymuconolactone decarboxylase family protein, partial [Phycicoccus sp.]